MKTNKQDSLMEATLLALQGKLELKEENSKIAPKRANRRKVEEKELENKRLSKKQVESAFAERRAKRKAMKENVDVSVEDDGTTVVDTPEATVTVQDNTVVNTFDNAPETIEVPTTGDETIVPEVPAEELPVEVDDQPTIDEIVDDDLEENKTLKKENKKSVKLLTSSRKLQEETYLTLAQEYDIDELGDLLWSGAADRWNDDNTTDEMKEEVIDRFCEYYDDVQTVTTFNDFVWFDCDDIFDNESDEDELDESKKLKKEAKDLDSDNNTLDEIAFQVSQELNDGKTFEVDWGKLQNMIIKFAKDHGYSEEEVYESDLEPYVRGYLAYSGWETDFNTGDMTKQKIDPEKNKKYKRENVNINVSEDGQNVEVVTDNAEEVEVIDETPEETEEIVDNDGEFSEEEFFEESKECKGNCDKECKENDKLQNAVAKARNKQVEARPTFRGRAAKRVESKNSMNKARAMKESQQVKTNNEKKVEAKGITKFSSKSFTNAIKTYCTENYKSVADFKTTSVSIDDKSIKVEGKMISKRGTEKAVEITLNKKLEGRTFIKYELSEGKGLMKESLQKDNTIAMMTTKSQNGTVLECKYLKKKTK